jgi:hypothetical protein
VEEPQGDSTKAHYDARESISLAFVAKGDALIAPNVTARLLDAFASTAPPAPAQAAP